MPFIILSAGIILLILLITAVRLNAFLSFIIVAAIVGLLNGMQIEEVTTALQKGIGDLLGSLIIILGLGAMLGKLISDSGAAQQISNSMIHAFGKKYIMWALVLAAFIIGIPLFYGVGFVLMVPLIVTISKRNNIPAVYIGLPMLSALSVTHGYLPPHPSPAALVTQYNADLGLTLLYGFIIAIPAIIIAGPMFSVTLKNYTKPPPDIFIAPEIKDEELPSLFMSIFTAILPVLLITLGTVSKLLIANPGTFTNVIIGLGDPVVAMVVTLLFAVYSLGIAKGRNMNTVMSSLSEAAKDISMILFIIGGAGALKQILTESGTSNEIAAGLSGMHVHPLFAAWLIAAIIRVCLGSATVAGLTTAGIVAPLIISSGVDPNLMVLSTGAGSLMFSHVNDTGFWMFKEYFGLSIKETLKTWSIMETIVSVVGLIGVFALNYFI